MKSIGLVLLGAMAACASTNSPNVRVQADSSAVASLAAYRTFAFGLAGTPPAPFQVSGRSFEVERRMRSLVAAELETAEEGEIVIDAFDASSAGQVWHGTGETEVDPKQINDQLLQVGVERVLASFPARSSEGRPGVTFKQAP